MAIWFVYVSYSLFKEINTLSKTKTMERNAQKKCKRILAKQKIKGKIGKDIEIHTFYKF